MIEKAKKYLLEHNILWINPEEQEQYKHIDNFSIDTLYLTYNTNISIYSTNVTNFLSHLGGYSLVNHTRLYTVEYYTLRINNQGVGLLLIQRLQDGRQRIRIKIERFSE